MNNTQAVDDLNGYDMTQPAFENQIDERHHLKQQSIEIKNALLEYHLSEDRGGIKTLAAAKFIAQIESILGMPYREGVVAEYVDRNPQTLLALENKQ